MPAKTHTMHGRDHCHNGADPIPCLPPMSPVAAGDYALTVVSITDLLGYWRLGEASTPWADTSGTSPPADLTLFGTGPAPTPDVTGALEADDDGAFELNYNGTSAGQFLMYTSGANRFQLPEFTAVAWIKTKASATASHGLVIGNTTQIVSGGDHISGWGLEVVYPSQALHFTFGQPAGFGTAEVFTTTPAGLVADTWYMVAGTYDTDTMKLYLNATLVDSYAINDYVGNPGKISIGAGVNPINATGWFYGTVDEAAVWDRALTATELATLYTAGAAIGGGAGHEVLISDGEGGASWGQVTPEAIEAGDDREVLRSSGGTVAWALPTLRVNY